MTTNSFQFKENKNSAIYHDALKFAQWMKDNLNFEHKEKLSNVDVFKRLLKAEFFTIYDCVFDGDKHSFRYAIGINNVIPNEYIKKVIVSKSELQELKAFTEGMYF